MAFRTDLIKLKCTLKKFNHCLTFQDNVYERIIRRNVKIVEAFQSDLDKQFIVYLIPISDKTLRFVAN